MTYLSPNEHFPGVGDGIAKCPFDPDDNATAVWVGKYLPDFHYIDALMYLLTFIIFLSKILKNGKNSTLLHIYTFNNEPL